MQYRSFQIFRYVFLDPVMLRVNSCHTYPNECLASFLVWTCGSVFNHQRDVAFRAVIVKLCQCKTAPIVAPFYHFRIDPSFVINHHKWFWGVLTFQHHRKSARVCDPRYLQINKADASQGCLHDKLCHGAKIPTSPSAQCSQCLCVLTTLNCRSIIAKLT